MISGRFCTMLFDAGRKQRLCFSPFACTVFILVRVETKVFFTGLGGQYANDGFFKTFVFFGVDSKIAFKDISVSHS